MLADGAIMPPGQILNGFGCHGGNRSPALAWNAPPPSTKSLAITMDDPAAPTGSGWSHSTWDTIFMSTGIPSWCLLHEIAHAMTSNAEGISYGHRPISISVDLKLIPRHLRVDSEELR